MEYTIVYEQIWAMDLYLEQPISITSHGEVALRFLIVPQIKELVDLGFSPVISKRHDMASQNIIFTVMFTIPEQVKTFMLLKYPNPVSEVNFEDMITIIERDLCQTTPITQEKSQ